jgi:hypothetical protein
LKHLMSDFHMYGVSEAGHYLLRGVRTRLRRFGQPAALEARTAQARRNIWTAPHEPPDQLGAIVLDHQNDRSLIEREVVVRDPAGTSRTAGRKCRIDTADEPILAFHLPVLHRTVLQGGEHDLRGEGQRCDDGPRCQCAIVGTVRHTSRCIPKEAPCDSSHSARGRTRPFARRDAPGVLANSRQSVWDFEWRTPGSRT